MKKNCFVLLVAFFSSFSILLAVVPAAYVVCPSNSIAPSAPPVNPPVEPISAKLTIETLSKMSLGELEVYLGRKLSFPEEIIFKSFQRSMGNIFVIEEPNDHHGKDADVVVREDCDVIYFQNGKEISCKIQEVGPNEIKYKPCDDPNGFTTSIAKKDVKAYRNGRTGEMSFVEGSGTANKTVNESSKTDGFAITSFVLAVLSLLGIIAPVAPFLFSLLSIIFGIVGLGRIRKRGTKGSWMAIFGIVVGSLAILGALIILLLIL
jgi:hypothetical protein